MIQTKTEEKIERTLLDILKNNKYGDIYVKDICEKANVNRSTFYKHYNDINDLIVKTQNKLNDKLTQIYSPHKVCTLQTFENLFDFLYNHQNFYRTYFLINKNTYNEINTIFNSNSFFDTQNNQYDESTISYQMSFFAGGLKAVSRQWILLGCKESPKVIAQMIFDEYKTKIDTKC